MACVQPGNNTENGNADDKHDDSDDVTEGTEKKMKSNYKKLRKIIEELIDTEKIYVQDLHGLIEHYLEPVKSAKIVQADIVGELFGNIEEIAEFQDEFSKALQEPMKLLTDISQSNESQIFKRVLFSIGSAFLYFADNFKVYSSFTASHTRSQRIFCYNKNQPLKDFLMEHGKKCGFATSLDSYMIKPIQRIMKYPLFLRDMCHVIDPDADEHYHLSQALKEIERVNKHINKMQEIYEDYGEMLDDLCKKYNQNGDSNAEKRKSNVQNKVDLFQKIIPIFQAKAQDGEFEDSGNLHWWDLIHTSTDKKGPPVSVFKLCCSSAEEKASYLKQIQQLSRRKSTESQRKSSYVAFGGKRLESLSSGTRPGLRKLSRRREERT